MTRRITRGVLDDDLPQAFDHGLDQGGSEEEVSRLIFHYIWK